MKTENFRSSLVTFRLSDSRELFYSKRRSWGHGRQEGCARSGSSTAFVARKSEDFKAMNGFCITQVMDVLSVFTFGYLKCLHSWHNISNLRKIFVAEGNSYIFFVPFSYEHFTFHVYSPSLKCLLVRFDCVDTNRANKNYHTWQQSLAVHFISSFINHKWDLVCYSFSNSIAPNITSLRTADAFPVVASRPEMCLLFAG